MIHVVAVDPLGTTYRTRERSPEQPAQFVDLRLKNGLDPTQALHAAEAGVGRCRRGRSSRSPTSWAAASRCTTASRRSTRFYATLSKDPNFTEFGFVLTWPKLKPEEKRTLYSKYACHELNFFLSKKDPQFFAEVVKPYLTNKKDKTFLDHWLLGDDVTRLPEAVGIRPTEHGRTRAARAAHRPASRTRLRATSTTCSACCRRTSIANCSCSTSACEAGGLDTDDAVITNRLERRGSERRRRSSTWLKHDAEVRPARLSETACRFRGAPPELRRSPGPRRRAPRRRHGRGRPTSRRRRQQGRPRQGGLQDKLSKKAAEALLRGRPGQAKRRAPTVPQARPDDGVGREQLLQAADPASRSPTSCRSARSGSTTRGTTARRRSCRGTSARRRGTSPR